MDRATEHVIAEFGTVVASLLEKWTELFYLHAGSLVPAGEGRQSPEFHVGADITVRESSNGVIFLVQLKQSERSLGEGATGERGATWHEESGSDSQLVVHEVVQWLTALSLELGVTREDVLKAFRDILRTQIACRRHAIRSTALLSDQFTPSLTELDPVPHAAVEQAQRVAELRALLLASGAFTYAALAAGRGSSIPATRQWVRRAGLKNELFAVKHGNDVLIPAFLLDEALAPRAAAKPAIAALRSVGEDGWALWAWFATPSAWLGGATPSDALSTNPALVTEAAERRASNAA